MTSEIAARAPYQGLVQIFNFNRPFYIRTLSGAIASIILSMWLPLTLRSLLLTATGAAIFGPAHRCWSRITSTIDLDFTTSIG